MKLSKESFRILSDALELAGKYCTDVSIVNNTIRQLSDDRVVILEICFNIPETIEKLNVADVKKKFKIFRLLSNTADESIDLDIEERYYTISDGITTVRFAHPSDDILTTTFIDDEKIRAKTGIDSAIDLIDFVFDESMLSKINALVDHFNSRRLIFVPTDNKHCTMRIISSDKIQKSDIVQLPLVNELSETLAIAKDPFDVASDNAKFQLKKTGNSYLCILKTQLNDSLNLTIYTRAGVTDE